MYTLLLSYDFEMFSLHCSHKQTNKQKNIQLFHITLSIFNKEILIFFNAVLSFIVDRVMQVMTYTGKQGEYSLEEK